MKILIADDHGIVREGLRALMERRPDVEVVGEASDGRTAIDLVQQLAPNVVIMDITMPGLNGVDATRAITRDAPKVKVIALSMHADKHIVREMLDAGAHGYVLKSNLFDELSRAIEAVQAGGRYLSPRITGVVVEDYIAGGKTAGDDARKCLSEREREILQLLAEGRNLKEISLHLHISPKTTDTHRRHIMTKLGANSAADLVKYAIKAGITSLDF